MDILDGRIVFRPGEAAEVIDPTLDTRHEELTAIGTNVSEVGPEDARRIVQTLHAVIVDTKLPERNRIRAANALLAVSFAGLRSSIQAEERFARHQHIT